MRKQLWTIPALLVLMSFSSARVFAANFSSIDTAKAPHLTDGDLSEWRADKFETDKETQVMYSVDHDAKSLHLALKVTNPQTQMKMMRMGMLLYIDKKGKKREGTGIEFPIRKTEDGMGARPGGDPKEMRERLASNMIFLKTFGFEDEEKTQLIAGGANAINIAFNWDESNVLAIEYEIPLSLFGNPADLNGKPLGIGWKINGAPEGGFSNGAPTRVSSQIVGVPAGSGPPSGAGGRGAGRPAPNSSSTFRDNMMSEQSFWTKYSITL